MSQKTVSRLKVCFIVLSILAAIKVIFVDYTMDEEYQIVMAYRHLMGEAYFKTMWEPHQTSAFVCVWLMRIFIALTKGTTGVVLFLRCITCVIQLGFSVWIAKALEKFVHKDYAFLLGGCYFNIVPKIIQIPEFSNLQLWFFTIMVLALLEYYEGARKKRWLLLSGVGMALEVLAYPSSLLLFPFFLGYIFIKSGKGKKGLFDSGAFACVCGVCAIVWLLLILKDIPFSEFVRNVKYLLEFDLTHDVSLGAEYRKTALVQGVKTLTILLGSVGVLGGIATYVYCLVRKHQNVEQQKIHPVIVATFFVFASMLVQIFYWVVLQRGYEEPQIHLLTILLVGFWMIRYADAPKKAMYPGLIGGVISILAVVYMSDLGVWYAIPHGLLGTLCAVVILIMTMEKQLKDKGRGWILLLLFSLAFCSVFGKGFTLRAGTTETNSVLGIRGVMKKGPTAGIFTGYMQSYIMNCTYEDFEQNVKPGEKCLIVTNLVASAGTTPYLFDKYEVSHFSIVDPTSYDERLLAYWECYPEKRPNVIVVDCWYGQLMEEEDSWIMQYIENDFGYTAVEDGRYVRFYIREDL